MKAVNFNEKTSHLNDMRESTYLTVVWDFSVLSFISAWKPPKNKFIYDLVRLWPSYEWYDQEKWLWLKVVILVMI